MEQTGKHGMVDRKIRKQTIKPLRLRTIRKRRVTNPFLTDLRNKNPTALRKLTLDEPKISALEGHSHAATWYERARYEKAWARSSNSQGRDAASIESGADNPEAMAKIREMTEEAVEAGYKFDPLIRPDLQIRQRQGPTSHADNKYNRSVHIKHGEICCVSCL